MKREIFFGEPSEHGGQFGVRVDLRLNPETSDEWSGVYEFFTHGMTPEEVAAKITEIETAHARRGAIMSAYQRKDAKPGEPAITDFRITDRGTNIEIHVVAAIKGQSHSFRRVYPTSADIPTREQLLAEIDGETRRRESSEISVAAEVVKIKKILKIIG